MATSKALFVLCTLTLFLSLSVYATQTPPSRVYGDFYRTSCPEAESVIAKAAKAQLDKNLKHAAGLIRMAFHDCFVEVCDGSVLLDGKDIGKNAAINVNLLGLDVIEAAKTAVEAVCPGVVSCADIFANAARDSTVKLNGAGGVVQGGRKDDTVPSAAPAKNDLPLPPFDVSQLIDSFAKRDHSTEQMVIV